MDSIIGMLVILLLLQQVWQVAKRSDMQRPRRLYLRTPLEVVHERYAQGLISHGELEQLVAGLIASEERPPSTPSSRRQPFPAAVTKQGGGNRVIYPPGAPTTMTRRGRNFCGCR